MPPTFGVYINRKEKFRCETEGGIWFEFTKVFPAEKAQSKHMGLCDSLLSKNAGILISILSSSPLLSQQSEESFLIGHESKILAAPRKGQSGMNHGRQGLCSWCLYQACPNDQSTCMCTHCYRGGTSFVRLISKTRLRELQTYIRKARALMNSHSPESEGIAGNGQQARSWTLIAYPSVPQNYAY